MTDRCDIIAEFWQEMDKSPFVMLGVPSQGAHAVPMTAQFDDDYPNTLFFFTSKTNRLSEAAGTGPAGVEAMLHFAAKGHDFFACAEGRLTRIDDAAIRDKFWTRPVSSWFEGGKEDPKLQMLRLDLSHAEMWEADMDLEGMMKMIFGGKIDKDEAEEKHIETAM